MVNIICIGSNRETAVVLQNFIKCNLSISCLICFPDNKFDKPSDYEDLRPYASELNAEVIETDDVNHSTVIKKIRHFRPDYIFILGWSQMIDDELLSIPSQMVVGSHPSPLPHGRGRAPVPWTILERQNKSAVSLFKMTEKPDAGEILIQKPFDIPERTNANELYTLVSENLAEAFSELYQKIKDGENITGVKQSLEQGSVRARRGPSDGIIDFSSPAAEVDCLVRAISAPYPGAYSYYKQKRVIFENSDIYHGIPYKGQPGQILKKRNKSAQILVQTGDDPLWLTLRTGQDLDIQDINLGDKLGYNVQDEINALKSEIYKLRQEIEDLKRGKV